jgi:hypothetical protein
MENANDVSQNLQQCKNVFYQAYLKSKFQVIMWHTIKTAKMCDWS